ncbi:MAG: hypothetical protein ACRDFR_06255 [Candidatus Limnocylindria bacterium]
MNVVQLGAVLCLAGFVAALISGLMRRFTLMWIGIAVSVVGLGIAVVWTITL